MIRILLSIFGPLIAIVIGYQIFFARKGGNIIADPVNNFIASITKNKDTLGTLINRGVTGIFGRGNKITTVDSRKQAVISQENQSIKSCRALKQRRGYVTGPLCMKLDKEGKL